MGLTTNFAWWQLWTCHLWHWDAQHLLLNVAASIPPLLLLPRRALARVLLGALVAAPALSLVILAVGLEGEYRGASGLVVALWVFTALTLLRSDESRTGWILFAAIAAKLVAEGMGWWSSGSASYATLPLAHYAGAGVAALTSVRFVRHYES